MKETIPFRVSRTELELQDLYVDFDSLTELSDGTLFEMEELFHRPWEMDSITIGNISVELNRDVLYVQREGYTSLDLISDIGGMQGLLFTAISAIVAIINYN